MVRFIACRGKLWAIIMPDVASSRPRRPLPWVAPAIARGRAFRRVLVAAGLVGGLLPGLLAGPAQAQSSAAAKGGGAGAGTADRSCAQYGAGFQKLPGSDSCVRVGAAVRTDGYSGHSVSSASNQFSGSSGTVGASGSDATDPWKSAR